MATKSVRVILEALVSQYQAKMGAATASTRAFGASVLASSAKNSAAFSTVGIAAAALGAAVLFGLKQAGDAAMEFEGNLTKMVTLVGLTRGEVTSMGEEVLKLRDTGKGPLELSEALYFLTSAGLSADESMTVLEASAKAAAIGLGDTVVVADLVASAINAYGAANLSAAEAVDVLINTVKYGKAEAADLAGVMGRVLPVASAMGVKFNEVGAAIAAMTLTGNDANTAATQLRAILSGLLKPAQQAEDALLAVGLSGRYLRDVIREEGLWAALQELTGAIDVTDAAMAKVFPNVRALTGVMSLLGKNALDNDSIFRGLAGSTGVLAAGFKVFSDSTEGAQARFSASMEAMAVSVGSVLLPAMTAGFDIGTGFAGLITDLPGPLKAVAVAVLAVAGALLLVGGATMMLLPRIQLVKKALLEAGISAGVFRGSLMFAGKAFLNPYLLMLTAATIGLTYWSAKKAEAKQRVEAFTDAIEADSGAIGENTRALVANRLEEERALLIAKDFGIALDDVVDAALGDEVALMRVSGALADAGVNFDATHGPMAGYTSDEMAAANAAKDLLGAITGVNGEMEAGQTEASRLAEALGGDGGGVADAALTAEETLSMLRDEIAATEVAADLLTAALEALAGTELDVEKASLAWLDSIAELGKELRKGQRTLDDNTQAGRDNRAAILSSVDAALQHAAAVAQETGSIDKGAAAAARHIEQIMGEAAAAGISRGAIRDYIEQLNLTPAEIRTKIRLLGGEEATHEVERFKLALDQLPNSVSVGLDVTGGLGGGPLYHAGGTVGTTGARRLHSGGRLRGGERLFIGQPGEEVLSTAAVGSLRRILSIAPASGGSGSPGFARAIAELARVLQRQPMVVSLDRRAFGEHLDREYATRGI